MKSDPGTVPVRSIAYLLAVLALVVTGRLASAQPIPDIDAEETPLHWAAHNGLLDIARGLVSNGANVSAPDQFGRTPLHRAVASPSMVAFLIRAGANVNAADVFGRTPLHEALPYTESVVLLLDAGADIEARDFHGNTPLKRALRYGTGSRNRQVIELLIAAGAGAPAGER
ncbi:MAG: ankyrin repeat domain-containing protein [Spirochaetota bacterium]